MPTPGQPPKPPKEAKISDEVNQRAAVLYAPCSLQRITRSRKTEKNLEANAIMARNSDKSVGSSIHHTAKFKTGELRPLGIISGNQTPLKSRAQQAKSRTAVPTRAMIKDCSLSNERKKPLQGGSRGGENVKLEGLKTQELGKASKSSIGGWKQEPTLPWSGTSRRGVGNPCRDR